MASPVRARPVLQASVSPEVRAEVQRRAELEGKPLSHVVDAYLRAAFGLGPADVEPQYTPQRSP